MFPRLSIRSAAVLFVDMGKIVCTKIKLYGGNIEIAVFLLYTVIMSFCIVVSFVRAACTAFDARGDKDVKG